LIDLEGAEALRQFTPDFEHLLFDLQDYGPSDVRGGARLRIILLAMKYVFSPDLIERLLEIIGVLNTFPRGDRDAIESIETVLIYWSRARGLKKEEVTRALEQRLTPEERNTMSTIIDEWKKEARIEGLRQGEYQGAIAVVLRLLQARFGALDPDVEQMVRSLPVERMQQLGDVVLNLANPDDLVEWMNETSGSN